MATCARLWAVETETVSPCPGPACPVGLTGREISVHGPGQRKTQDSQKHRGKEEKKSTSEECKKDGLAPRGTARTERKP